MRYAVHGTKLFAQIFGADGVSSSQYVLRGKAGLQSSLEAIDYWQTCYHLPRSVLSSFNRMRRGPIVGMSSFAHSLSRQIKAAPSTRSFLKTSVYCSRPFNDSHWQTSCARCKVVQSLVRSSQKKAVSLCKRRRFEACHGVALVQDVTTVIKWKLSSRTGLRWSVELNESISAHWHICRARTNS